MLWIRTMEAVLVLFLGWLLFILGSYIKERLNLRKKRLELEQRKMELELLSIDRELEKEKERDENHRAEEIAAYYSVESHGLHHECGSRERGSGGKSM